MSGPAKVLIVDDSATMRALLRSRIAADPRLLVVGEAADADAARAAIKALNPDVITLDIEMPRMNGLDFLERLMRLRPMPVVMVSSLTSRGAELTLAALELGAIDCVAKGGPAGADAFDDLADILVVAAGAHPRMREAPAAVASDYVAGDRVVAIGSSTGGVEALLHVLACFPANCPPTLVTQHMPASFTASFAARLDRVCAPEVSEAQDGADVVPGRIYLAPGGATHLTLQSGSGGRLACRLTAEGPVSGHRPSVDVLFRSVAAVGARGVGVILTGMGRDGAEGLLAMRRRGATTIAQDEATSIVYGMPRAAEELGAVERVLPLHRIGPAVLRAAAQPLQGAA
ncbi:MAG: chemotaxis response regulator protein-glutamate methylesterase [Phenylobacterium sp.]|uniref:protein-glutamate methylesterase/protein-glutamine glutaminase n=1 Tax=Phenylobacterium sp. TaxID=1871053 RepID=UPI001A582CEE|nr:chemotaxis response regulator protein-glutamate methylesterase [Phenylobacterium sp.]MBL8774014.1 chemotaxis response regulator protein-glutamate methylesterase [Phenylobacterium sp.]